MCFTIAAKSSAQSVLINWYILILRTKNASNCSCIGELPREQACVDVRVHKKITKTFIIRKGTKDKHYKLC